MLDYKLINYKPTITYNNDEYIDLLASTFNDSATFSPQFIIVNENYVARPDLISLAMYGDDRYGDIICKLNGISNPFELNEDDVLIIPNIEYLNTCIKKTRNASEMIDNPKETYIQKIDKNNKQIQSELTWSLAKDVMKNKELRRLYYEKYGVKYKVRKERRRKK